MFKRFLFILSGVLLFVTASCQTSTETDRYTNGLRISKIVPLKGSPGTNITILGKGFSPVDTANIVRFGGAKAQVIRASRNKILVTVPLDADTGKITVAVNGKITESNSVFTVVDEKDVEIKHRSTEKLLQLISGVHYVVPRNYLYNRPNQIYSWQVRWRTTPLCQAANGCQIKFDDRVTAIALRYKWAQVNPAEGVYHFDNIGHALDVIHDADKLATIVIMGGKYTPKWVIDKGTKTFSVEVLDYGVMSQPKLPLPWDDIYISSYGKMIQALSDYLKEKPTRYNTVALVKIGGLVVHSGENRLLPLPAFFTRKEIRQKGEEKLRTKLGRAWAKVGYTQKKVLRANRQFARQVANAFPDQLIGMANVPGGSNRFPTVINGEYKPDKPNRTNWKLATQLADMYGARAVVNSTTLYNEKSAKRPYLQAVLKHGGNIAYQLNARKVGCRKPRYPCNRNDFIEAMRAGINAGAVFIEVHDGNYVRYKDLLIQFNAEMSNNL